MSQVLNTLDLITQFLLVAFRGILSHPPFLGTRIPSPNPLRTSPPPLLRGEIYLKFRGYNGSKVLVAARSRHPRLICITIGMISVLEC